ncbi:MAG TPA: hypothetical protein VGX03_31295 [Candidatus Binatia bacterium]|nr:hypothetical protein [Candidatus Binatia bacterium]
MVIGTYRPVEVLANGHPLRAVTQELQLHQSCQDVPLGLLSEGDIAAYLTTRFPAGVPGGASLRPLAQLIHQRTEGNPLFMVTVIEEWLGRGEVDLEEMGVNTPRAIGPMIERQFDHLTFEEQQVLAVASVAGIEFSAAAVAAGAGADVAEVEARCAALARRGQFLRASGTAEWPDGTVAARYSFLHALYQEVIYGRVTAGRRQRLHQQIGEREEQAYGEQAKEIAAELAVHFERGRDYRRAVQYLRQAGENAVRRSAHQEAVSLLTKGLELLKTLPDSPERARQELPLQISLGTPLIATKGYGAPEVGKVYTRARELCQQVGETPQLWQVLNGLRVFYNAQGELQMARELAEQIMRLAQSAQHPDLLMVGHIVLGEVPYCSGEWAPARGHFERALALYDPRRPRSSLAWVDAKVPSLSYTALALWMLGYPAQALKRSQEALTLAQELSHPFTLAFALQWAAVLHHCRREVQATQEQAEALIALSIEQGFPHWLAIGTVLRGWVLAEQGQGEEGIAQIRKGMAAWQAAGLELRRPYFLALLAEAHGKVGQAKERLTMLSEALAAVDRTGERMYEAELYRLKGTLTLQSQTSPKQVQDRSKASRGKSAVTSPQPLIPNPQAEVERDAEEYFHKAIEIARKQQANSLELRAVMSLSRLWQRQGKKNEARQMLAGIYNWFTEGFDTADLKEAKALLEGLG